VIELIVFVSHESGSVSLVRTAIEAIVFSLVVAESLTAVGVSFTQLTVIVAVQVLEISPITSLKLYVKVATPQKFAGGV
jgi:hypothetical protein